jgi:DNA-binding NtrC family response regulator
MLRILLSMKNGFPSLDGLLKEHAVETANGHGTLADRVAAGNFDLLIAEGDAALVSSIKCADPRVEVILFGSNGGDEVEAVRCGASAYFTAPFDLTHLNDAIKEIAAVFETRSETARLEEELISKYTFAGIVGRNPKMLDLFSLTRRIAPYFRTVTIMGETGTGKELVARALHTLSTQSKQPFVVCNCGGFVETLIESELFGHKKGSFTGAVRDRVGLFQAAGTGTLFLDEIGELPLAFQPHLLRALQNGEYRPVGSTELLYARCRIVAATSKNLAEEVKKGRFREDLYYRLTPLTITIPPLRERKDDLLLLSRYFLGCANTTIGKNVLGISRSVQETFMGHEWPGNVRELENVITQAVILSGESFVKPDHLPAYLFQQPQGKKSSASQQLEDMIRAHLEAVLAECRGNRTHAAKKLGVSRRSLLRRIEKYALRDRPEAI